MAHHLDTILTQKERKVRKHWLAFLLLGVGMQMVFALFAAICSVDLREAGPIVLYTLICLGFSYLPYYFCYKKQTTFLITFSLVSSVISLSSATIAFFIGIGLALPEISWETLTTQSWVSLAGYISGQLLLFLVFAALLSIGFYYCLLQLHFRRINKYLTCLRRFPELCSEAALHIQKAENPEQLKTLHAEGCEKWNQLTYFLNRETRLKAKEFSQRDK